MFLVYETVWMDGAEVLSRLSEEFVSILTRLPAEDLRGRLAEV